MSFYAVLVLASAVALSSCSEQTFADLPNPDNLPAMARFIVNNANWTSFAHIACMCEDFGNRCPGNAVFATSDGDIGCGSGIPYFWSSRHHPTINILLDKNPRGSIAMTLAQTNICKERGWDPQDPRCAHVTIDGTFTPINESSSEHAVAKKALLTRHPQFSYYPPGHSFFYAKLNITKISIISKFGGPVEVNLQDYFKHKC